MGRPKRVWHPKGFYHITMRGNNRQNIFNEKADVQEYYRILSYVDTIYPFELYAYCIMSNHLHLLLCSRFAPLGILMNRINKRYSDYYRFKYNYTGQLYERRYYSKEVFDSTGLLHVSSYIHANPIETKNPMVASLENYPYSSYPYYYHNLKSNYPFLQLQLLPSILPAGIDKTATAYAKFCIDHRKEQLMLQNKAFKQLKT